MNGIGTPDDPMERIRAVFEEPYPVLPIPPGTWERIETEARRRRRTHRLRLVGSVAASLLVVGAGVGLLWPQLQPSPSVAPGGSTVSSSTGTPSPSLTTPAPAPSTPRSTGSTQSPTGSALPKGGPVPKDFWPTSLSGASGPEGRYLYVLGDSAGCGNPVCTSMVRSADGGRTWVGIPAPVAEVGGDTPDAVREIRFATPTDGYAYGPTLFETHDGGATWTRRKLSDPSDQVLDLAVAADRIWVVTASCDGNGCAKPQLMSADATGGPLEAVSGVSLPSPVTMVRFGDGGGSLTLRADGQDGTGQWVRQPGSGWRAMSGPCAVVTDFPLQLSGLSPAADGSGEVVALCAGTGPDAKPVAVVTTSQDAGRTWTAGGLQPVPSGQLLLAAADRDRIVIAGVPDGSGPSVWVSQDAGVTWEAATGDVPPVRGFRWLGAGGGGQVYALLGADGLLYRSGSGTAFSSRPIG